MLVRCEYMLQEISHDCVSELYNGLGEREKGSGEFQLPVDLGTHTGSVGFCYLVGV